MPRAASHYLYLCWFLLGAVVVGGCTGRIGGAKIYRSTVESNSVPGLLEHESIQSYALYVHGMGETDVAFAQPLLKQAAEIAGASIDPPLPTAEASNNDRSCAQDINCRRVALPEPIAIRGEGLRCDDDPSLCLLQHFGELRRASIQHGNKTLNLYSFYWDAAADQIQAHYSYLDLEVPNRPVLINRAIKDRIVTYGFSDAALYLGSFGPVMRSALEAALCMMLRDQRIGSFDDASICILGAAPAQHTLSGIAAIEQLNIQFMAKSLGSRYLFDTLLPLDQLNALQSHLAYIEQENAEPGTSEFSNSDSIIAIQRAIAAKRAIVAATTKVYFLANQLPLLGLGTVSQGTVSEQQERDRIYCHSILQRSASQCGSPLAALNHAAVDKALPTAPPPPVSAPSFWNFASSARAGEKLLLVAYHDPNDALGYKAGDHLTNAIKESLDLIELEHHNAREWAFAIANPLRAHANEDDTRSAAKILLCGGQVNEQANVVANDC